MTALARKEVARRRSVRIGAVTLAAVVGVVAFAITAQNGMPEYVPGVSRTEVKAAFDDTGALREGDDVRIANVRSGFVDNIELIDGVPIVTMRLDGGREVYQDASVTVGTRSALGQKFIELDPGSSDTGEMDEGATIPASRTTETVELDEVLESLDAPTRARLGQAVRATGRGLGGRGGDLSDALRAAAPMLGDVQAISEALTADDGQDLVDLLDAADLLASDLDDQRDELSELVEDVRTTNLALNVDEGTALEEVLQRAPSTLRDVRTALKTLDEPLRRTGSAAVALRPGAEALGVATPDLRAVLREGVDPLRKVPAVTEDASSAVDALTPLLDDARPVVEQLGTALERAQRPLANLAPYAPEVLLFFANAQSALSQGDAAGRWLRFYPVYNPEIFMSNVPIDNPLTRREAYPAPGAAPRHRTTTLGDQLSDLP